MMRWFPGVLAAGCAFLLLLPAWGVLADPEADRAAITQRLQRWTTAFNAGDAAGACDIFAPDLVATMPDSLDTTRDVLCARIAGALAKTDPVLHYDLEIREILVAGDLAAVRVFWTLTTRHGAERTVSLEPGLDVFRRQPDGRWSIARYLAFSTKP